MSYRAVVSKLGVCLALALVLSACLVPYTMAQELRPGEGVTVRMGKASWTSAEPVAAVYVELLEELGYTVDGPTLFSSNPIAYLAVTEGDIDVWPNGWFPLHNSQVPRNFAERTDFAGTVCEGCTLEGYLVDIPSIERFHIETLEDFTRPEVKAAFDADGDGRADLFGCPPGWGCHEVIEHHLDAYGLRQHINHVTADYTAGFANALARIRAGEPALFYTWTPNDTILQLVPGQDVKWIGVPYIDKAPAHEGFEDDALIAHGLEAAVTDPLPMGFVPGDILIVANKAFLSANPAAAALFEQVSLPLLWISEATQRISAGEDRPDEIRAIAREWIDANRTLTDAWLAAARAAGH